MYYTYSPYRMNEADVSLRADVPLCGAIPPCVPTKTDVPALQWCARLRIKSSHSAMLNPHTGLLSHPHTLLPSSSFPLPLAYFHCSFLSFGISFCFLPQISIYYSPPITSQKGQICCWLIVNLIIGFCLYFFPCQSTVVCCCASCCISLVFCFWFWTFPPLFWSPNRIHFS